MSGSTSGGGVRALAAAIYRQVLNAPVLALFTAVIAAVQAFGQAIAQFLGLPGLAATSLLELTFQFGASAIRAAAATSAGDVSTLGVLAFAGGVTVVGIAFYLVGTVVGLLE